MTQIKPQLLLLSLIICQSTAAGSLGESHKWSFSDQPNGRYLAKTTAYNQELPDVSTNLSKIYTVPLAYARQLGNWLTNADWELEIKQQKLGLGNSLHESQLPIKTFGYKITSINRAWNTHFFRYGVGVGAITSHTDLKLLDYTLDDWQAEPLVHPKQKIAQFSGLASQGSIQTRINISNETFFTVSGKLIYANIPTTTGRLDINQRTVHLLLGIGGSF